MIKIVKGKKTKKENAIIEITKNNKLSVINFTDEILKKILKDLKGVK